VELSRSRQHARLHGSPQLYSSTGQLACHCQCSAVKLAPACREATPQHLTVDVIDASDAGQHKVECEEVALEPVRDVVLACARVAHRCYVLQVFAHLLFCFILYSSSNESGSNDSVSVSECYAVVLIQAAVAIYIQESDAD
jgi:hypothetical protein